MGADGGPWLEVHPGVAIAAVAWHRSARQVLTPQTLALVAKLQREFGAQRLRLLSQRRLRQADWDAGDVPSRPRHSLAQEIAGDWQVATLPADLQRRRVEITGPISDPKMVINMLSRNAAGYRADCAMLDFEDSMKPSWANVVAGIHNLQGAAGADLQFTRAATAKRAEKVYRLDPQDMALVMVRCRGLHLHENNLRIDGEPVSAGLFDLAVSAAVSAAQLLSRGSTPKYYVPKTEHYLEARWWNAIFSALEGELDLSSGALRATFLIETLPAALQVEEILYELRERVAGLNVGRWDKIFSDIKVLKEHPDRVMADRSTITMQQPWMRDYALSLIHACHRHGAFAMGGMAAFTPGGAEERRAQQTEKVVADKRWESELGHDGCWVSHPYFIGPALSAFPKDQQLEVIPEIDRSMDLIPQGQGPRTLDGLRTNIRVGIAYLEGWSRDIGCVAWDDLMEDLATLEISRAQTWQWLRHGVQLDDGITVSQELVEDVFAQELARIEQELAGSAQGTQSFRLAASEACRLFCEPSFRPFLSDGSQVEQEQRSTPSSTEKP